MALDASDPLTVFAAIAGLILIGFLGNLIFAKTRFNDTLLLIGTGVVLGPILELVPVDALAKAQSIVGPLALILILYEGGLALNIKELTRGLARASLLSVVGFGASFGLVGLLAAPLLSISLTAGFLLGAIVGGTSALVVMPSLQFLKVDPKDRTMLSLESAITDILVVVLSFTLMGVLILGESLELKVIGYKIFVVFLLALAIGFLGAAAWLAVLPKVHDKPFSYMLTLAMMLLVYVVAEDVLETSGTPGGGPLSVLAFGLLVANHRDVGLFRKGGPPQAFQEGMLKFQGEISFVVRTFFFLYLGILVDLSLLADFRTIATSIVLFTALVVARYITVIIVSGKVKFQQGQMILLVMMPRGLASAVLASEAVNRGVPGAGQFVAIAFLLLLFTNLFTTVGAMLLERDSNPRSKGKPLRPLTTVGRSEAEVRAEDPGLDDLDPVDEKPAAKATPKRKPRA